MLLARKDLSERQSSAAWQGSRLIAVNSVNREPQVVRHRINREPVAGEAAIDAVGRRSRRMHHPRVSACGPQCMRKVQAVRASTQRRSAPRPLPPASPYLVKFLRVRLSHGRKVRVWRTSPAVRPASRKIRSFPATRSVRAGSPGYLTGREPTMRISTNLLALGCQSGLEATLATPTRARSRSIGSRSFRISPLLTPRFTSARIA